MRERRRVGVLLAAIALTVVAAACGDNDDGAPPTSNPLPPLLPLHAIRGDRPGIFDTQGRQVLLRGVNLNALGDYYQANPNYTPVYHSTIPTSRAWRSTVSTSCA